MKPNEPKLMWARQHWTGNIWHESAAGTAPFVAHWPPTEDGDPEQSEEEKNEQWGEIKLFKVTFEPVTPEESEAYRAQQEDLSKNRRNGYIKNKNRSEPLQSAQPVAAHPMTQQRIEQWWASENGLEDCKMCRLDDFTKVVRSIEAAHGIGVEKAST